MIVGRGGEVALRMGAAMLLHEGRQWGNHDDNEGKEEVVEEDRKECNDRQIIALSMAMRSEGNDKQIAALAMATCGKGNIGQVSDAQGKCKDG